MILVFTSSTGLAVKTGKKRSYFAVIPVQEKKAAAIFFQTEKGIQLPKDQVILVLTMFNH